MRTAFIIFPSWLICLSLLFVSGCGGLFSGTLPVLSPAEQAEVDKIIAEYGRDAIIRYMENFDTRNTDETLALKYLKHFISQGANVNAKGRGDDTPLHLAVSRLNVDAVKLLISKGADVNVRGRNGDTPLHVAIARGKTEVAKLLVSQGADVNVRGSSGYTPFHVALIRGDLDIAKFIVSSGADVNAIYPAGDGETLLHLAAFVGNIEHVRFLVSQGANINAQDNRGNTPLDRARGMGRRDVVEYLSGL